MAGFDDISVPYATPDPNAVPPNPPAAPPAAPQTDWNSLSSAYTPPPQTQPPSGGIVNQVINATGNALGDWRGQLAGAARGPVQALENFSRLGPQLPPNTPDYYVDVSGVGQGIAPTSVIPQKPVQDALSYLNTTGTPGGRLAGGMERDAAGALAMSRFGVPPSIQGGLFGLMQPAQSWSDMGKNVALGAGFNSILSKLGSGGRSATAASSDALPLTKIEIQNQIAQDTGTAQQLRGLYQDFSSAPQYLQDQVASLENGVASLKNQLPNAPSVASLLQRVQQGGAHDADGSVLNWGPKLAIIEELAHSLPHGLGLIAAPAAMYAAKKLLPQIGRVAGSPIARGAGSEAILQNQDIIPGLLPMMASPF